MSFTMSWLKQKFSNFWVFCLIFENRRHLQPQLIEEGQIFACIWSEIRSNSQLLKRRHKLAFLNPAISTEILVAFYVMYCKAVCSLLHRQPVSFTSSLRQTDFESPYVKISLKTDTGQQFTYLIAITFAMWSRNKPKSNNIIILHPYNKSFISLLHSTHLSVTSTTLLT